MATTSIHHHKFMVSDLARSVAFYRDLLGFEVMYEAEREKLPAYDTIIGHADIRLKIALLKLPDGSILALIEYLNPPPRTRELQHWYVGSSALCLVVDDIADDYRRLTAAGVRFQSPPVDIVRDGKLVAKACYFYDPDGISHELYEMPSA